LQLWRDLRIHRGTPRPRPRGTRARRAVGWRVPRSPGPPTHRVGCNPFCDRPRGVAPHSGDTRTLIRERAGRSGSTPTVPRSPDRPDRSHLGRATGRLRLCSVRGRRGLPAGPAAATASGHPIPRAV
jgi:hypothetical protein